MAQFDVVKKNLENRGFAVSCFATSEEAVAYLDSQIDGKTVGFGGSVTLNTLGLYEKLGTHNQMFWHQRVPDGKNVNEIKAAANGAQIYMSSVQFILFY